MLVSSNSCFHPSVSYMLIVLNGYLVHPCWGLHLGFRYLQIGGSMSAHGLPWVLLSCMWRKNHALIFASLMQSLSYMLLKKNNLRVFHCKVKVDFMCNICLLTLRFKFVYVVDSIITWHWKAQLKEYMSPFSSMSLVPIHLFPSGNFSYIGTGRSLHCQVEHHVRDNKIYFF